jgi:hypothetical protein
MMSIRKSESPILRICRISYCPGFLGCVGWLDHEEIASIFGSEGLFRGVSARYDLSRRY